MIYDVKVIGSETSLWARLFGRSACRSVGLSVLISYKDGKFHSHSPIERVFAIYVSYNVDLRLETHERGLQWLFRILVFVFSGIGILFEFTQLIRVIVLQELHVRCEVLSMPRDH